MKTFIETEIYIDGCGYSKSSLDLSSVVCFREHKYDCNATIVFTENNRFIVRFTYESFRNIMSKHFPSSFNN